MTMPTPIKAHRGTAPDDNAPHILVVDDDSRIRDLLARYLQDNGFRVTTAVDAATRARLHAQPVVRPADSRRDDAA